MVCGYSKLVSLDAGYIIKWIRVVCHHWAEKTSKNYSNHPCVWNSCIWTVFGHFLRSTLTWNTNSHFVLTSIKRHKFRVPIWDSEDKNISPFRPILQFWPNLSKRQKNQKKSFSIYFNIIWSFYSQLSKILTHKINFSHPLYVTHPTSVP